MTTRELPTPKELVEYEYAVAGHAGTLTNIDSSLFIKPCTAAEIDFYQSTLKFPVFAELLPKFYGTLTLSNATEITTAVDDIAAINTVVPETIVKSTAPAAPEDGVTWKPNKDKRIKTDEGIVLENLTHGYKKPNILDAKLGRQLWSPDAPVEKQQRFNAISAETTHAKFACRIAGMRIYKGSEDPAELDQEGYKIYDRDYGRVKVNNENFVKEIRKFVFNKTAGIDEELGKAVCKGFARELGTIEEVLTAHETKMFSSSLLFVFEGDGKALEDAIEQRNAMVDEIEARVPDTVRLDSGIDMDGEDSDEDPSLSFPKVFTLKLIDCAHAAWAPGDGPDENTLEGVQNLRKIFEDLSK